MYVRGEWQPTIIESIFSSTGFVCLSQKQNTLLKKILKNDSTFRKMLKTFCFIQWDCLKTQKYSQLSAYHKYSLNLITGISAKKHIYVYSQVISKRSTGPRYSASLLFVHNYKSLINSFYNSTLISSTCLSFSLPVNLVI